MCYLSHSIPKIRIKVDVIHVQKFFVRKINIWYFFKDNCKLNKKYLYTGGESKDCVLQSEPRLVKLTWIGSVISMATIMISTKRKYALQENLMSNYKMSALIPDKTVPLIDFPENLITWQQTVKSQLGWFAKIVNRWRLRLKTLLFNTADWKHKINTSQVWRARKGWWGKGQKDQSHWKLEKTYGWFGGNRMKARKCPDFGGCEQSYRSWRVGG